MGGAGVFFFFQAEDGIRDVAVTGVQTCALPILFRLYGHAFPAGYRDEYPVENAVTDIEMIESLAPQPDLGMNLYAPRAEPGILHFKIYRRGGRVPLSDSLPMLERLGVRVFFEHT